MYPDDGDVARRPTGVESAPEPGGPANPFDFNAPGQSPVRRLARALLWRLALTPLMLLAFMVMLVHGTTHRWPIVAWGKSVDQAGVTPAAVGVFFRQVKLKSPDGTALRAWHVPARSAQAFVRCHDQLLPVRRPAVVLCHGPWGDRSQLLYLVPPLHAAGYDLLLPDLRGCGASAGRISFGLNEWQDVQAAIDWLRENGSVDADRIALVGLECNAAAVFQAAAVNPTVRAVVADRPSRTIGDFFRRRFNAVHLPGVAFGRLYRWTLALTTGCDANQASAEFWAGELGPRQAMLLSTRRDDRAGPSADPKRIVAAAAGPTNFQVNPFSADRAHQPALLPGDLLKFLAEHLGPPDSELSGLESVPSDEQGL